MPAMASSTRLRSCSVPTSVEPCSRKRRLASRSFAIWRRESRPRLNEARAKSIALEPSISVLSRSKKAAAVGTHASVRTRPPSVLLVPLQLLDGEHRAPERRVRHARERRVPGRQRGGQADEAARLDDVLRLGGVADAEQQERRRQQEE